MQRFALSVVDESSIAFKAPSKIRTAALLQNFEADDSFLGGTSEFRCELDLAAAFAVGVEDGPARDHDAEHFLQAEGLGAKLGVVVVPVPAFADLELDGKIGAIGVALDYVALAKKAQALGPDGQGAPPGDLRFVI